MGPPWSSKLRICQFQSNSLAQIYSGPPHWPLVDSTNYLWPSMPSMTSLWPYLPGSFINSFATSLGTVVRSSCTAEKTLSYSLRAVLIAKRLEYKILHKANFGRHSVRHPMHDLGNMWKSEALVARYTSKALRVSKSVAKKWLLYVVMCCYSFLLLYVVMGCYRYMLLYAVMCCYSHMYPYVVICCDVSL